MKHSPISLPVAFKKKIDKKINKAIALCIAFHVTATLVSNVFEAGKPTNIECEYTWVGT